MANNKLTDEPMSLDTAIVHADERAASLSGSCAVQHTQLANWLRELQERRKAASDPVAWQIHTPETGVTYAETNPQSVENIRKGFGIKVEITPLYTAPPMPVVDSEPVADVVAWSSPNEERTCDIRWRKFDVAPGPLYSSPQSLNDAEWAELQERRKAERDSDPVAWWTGPEPTPTGEIESIHDHETGSHSIPLYPSRAAMLQAGNHTEQHLDMVDHSVDANEKVDCRLTFDQWLSQQDGTIDVDCGCVTTEAFYQWLRVAYEAGNCPVTPEGWIPVSERMPDEIGRYWCYVEEQNSLGKSHYQWNCSWNGKRWWIEGGGGTVTHWMLLPEPPQEVIIAN